MLNSELWQAPPAGGASFYDHQIEQSARFDRASASYLNRTIQSGGNLRKWTLSFWFKLTASAGFGSNQYYLTTSKLSSAYDTMIFDIDASSRFYYQTAGVYYYPKNPFRDISGWGHLVIVYDSDNSTQTDRKIMYLNGTRMVDHEVSGGGLGINVDSKFNSNSVHYIGARQDNGADYYGDYYLAEYIWADAQAYAPTQFGETKNGVWKPIDASGTNFGTTGYHLKFQTANALGDDTSGLGNDWTVNNMGVDHQVLDSPTIGTG